MNLQPARFSIVLNEIATPADLAFRWEGFVNMLGFFGPSGKGNVTTYVQGTFNTLVLKGTRWKRDNIAFLTVWVKLDNYIPHAEMVYESESGERVRLKPTNESFMAKLECKTSRAYIPRL